MNEIWLTYEKDQAETPWTEEEYCQVLDRHVSLGGDEMDISTNPEMTRILISNPFSEELERHEGP
jgi:hypothetical protein